MSARPGDPRVSAVVVSCIDPVLREVAVADLLSGAPGVVALRHDLHPDEGMLHRTVYDIATVLEDAWVPLDHACLSCAMREDILPTLERVILAVEPAAVVLALPVAAEPFALLPALTAFPSVRLAGVVSVFDADSFETDLLADDLLAERQLALSAGDRRSVGETLAHQIEIADLLLTPQAPSRRTAALLDHLVDGSADRGLLHRTDGRALFARQRDPSAARGDLLRVCATGATPREGVWTVDLQSWRPLHPQRLLKHIETLGTGRLRGRGHFWLPTRPDVICAWDGAGGQLSIGNHGHWTNAPNTHLVITGTDPRPDVLLTAFDATLLTDSELAHGLQQWQTLPDGMDPWLGEQRGAA